MEGLVSPGRTAKPGARLRSSFQEIPSIARAADARVRGSFGEHAVETSFPSISTPTARGSRSTFSTGGTGPPVYSAIPQSEKETGRCEPYG